MKSTKRERIKRILKRNPGVSPYLLNLKKSVKVYTHADLDILKKMISEGYKWVSIWNDLVEFYSEEGVLFADANHLNSKKWGGIPHYTVIRRALNSPELTLAPNEQERKRFRFWSNPKAEYVIDTYNDIIYYWSHNNAPITNEEFLESAEEVLFRFEFTRGGNTFQIRHVPAVEKQDKLIDLAYQIQDDEMDFFMDINPDDYI